MDADGGFAAVPFQLSAYRRRSIMRHTLYIYRATAQQVFDFLSRSQAILFNVNWVLNAPFEEPQTHNVYCELVGGNLQAARAALKDAAVHAGSSFEWEIMPDRL
jgi:hypothetical protein